MRKIILSAIILLLFCIHSQAQTQEVQDDFEGNGTIATWFGDNCNINTNFKNPYIDNFNSSPTVMEYGDVGGQYANVRFDVVENYDLSSNNIFSLKIYVPSSGITGFQNNQVSLILQDGTLAEPWLTQSAIIKPIVLDQWQTVSFDFLNDAYINFDANSLPPTQRTDFNRVLIQVNGDNNFDHVLAYIDDICFNCTQTIYPVYDVLIWSDEFDGEGAVDTNKWHHETKMPNPWGWHGGEVQHYTNRTDNSYVSNGILNIVGKKENYTDQGVTKEYTSARLDSKFAFRYGKVEVRAKIPPVAGTLPAIWMLGKNFNVEGIWWEMQGYGTTDWPDCGEIDIMEHWGSNQNYVSSATHTPSSFGATVNLGGQTISTATTEFHVYAVEWYTDKLIFSVDGVIHYTYQPDVYNSEKWPFNAEQFLLLNFALLPDIDPEFIEDALEIDYVRIYNSQDYPPTDISIDNSVFDENCSLNTVVGNFSSTYHNENATLTYSLIPGNGTNDVDNAKFVISGNELQTNASIDFESQNNFNIFVQTDAGNGAVYAKEFVITANNLNDNSPVLTDETFSIDENRPNQTVVGTISGADADGDLNPLTYSIIAGNTNDAFAIDNTAGKITVNQSSELNVNITPEFTLTVEVSEGTYTDTAIVTISLNDLTETGIHDLQLSNIHVYPSSTTGKVTIDFSNITNKLIKIGVINVTGQVVYMEKIENTKSTKKIDLSSYPKGIYFILLKSNNSIRAKKIILE